MKKKSILAILMSLTMIITSFPAMAFAANEVTQDDIEETIDIADENIVKSDAKNEGENIASGTSGTCDWVIDSEGTLTISAGEMGMWTILADVPWRYYADKIKKVKTLGTIHLKTCKGLFYGCTSLTSLEPHNFDTSEVTNMNEMFSGCASLTNLDVSNLDTSKVTNMSRMFCNCQSLVSLDLSGFDTSNVLEMEEMFLSCYSLVNLDLSSFDTSNVTNMSGMFSACKSLVNMNLSGFDTSNVTNMHSMFYWCFSLTSLDLSSCNSKNVKDFFDMFWCCNNLQILKLGFWSSEQIKDLEYRATFPVYMKDTTNGKIYATYAAIPDRDHHTFIAVDGDQPDDPGSTRRFKYFADKATYIRQSGMKNLGLLSMYDDNMVEELSNPIPGIMSESVSSPDSEAYISGDYVPQGLCRFNDYYVVSAYYPNEDSNMLSMFFVLDSNWDVIKYITIGDYKYHNGGIAYDVKGDYLWFCGNTNDKGEDKAKYDSVYCLSGKTFADAINSSEPVVHIEDFDKMYIIDNKSSCLDYCNGRLWVGTCGSKKGKIIGYRTDKNALYRKDIVKLAGVEKNLNGFTFDDTTDPDSIFCSYSSGRSKGKYSKITKYALNGELSLPGTVVKLNSIRTNDVARMNEEIMLKDGYLYILYESGARKYNNAYILTDRFTAMPESIWNSSLRKRLKALLASTAEDQITENDTRRIEFSYSSGIDGDEGDSNTDREFLFMPEQTGRFIINIADLESSSDQTFVTAEIVDDAGESWGEVSTSAYDYESETDAAFILNNGASLETNLVGGIRYKLILSAGTLDQSEQFNGTYNVSVSSIGDITSIEAAERTEVSDTVAEGGSSCFFFTPTEDGIYSVVWETDGVLGDIRILEGMQNEVEFNGDYCSLEAGKTYYFIATLNETNGASNSSNIYFTLEKLDESSLDSNGSIQITDNSIIEYKPAMSGRHIIHLEGNVTGTEFVSVYDKDGNNIGLGSDDILFTAEKGETYKLVCEGVSSNLSLKVDPYVPDVNDLDFSLSDTSFEYTGKAVTPAVKITESTYELINGTDYTVTYSNNIGPGTGILVIQGIGSYTGRKTASFTITEADKGNYKPSGGETNPSGNNNVNPSSNDSSNTDSQNATETDNGGNTSNGGTKDSAVDTASGTTHSVSGSRYKILTKSTVALTRARNKKSVKVPNTIKIGGKTFKVTQINAKAFTGKKIRTVTIGKNVKVIKKNAFKGSKTTKIILKTKLLKKAKVKASLKGSKIKTIQVKIGKKSVNKTYVKKYKKIFTKKNVGRKVKIK